MSMVYRIRYREAAASSEAEAVVEANSPNEALVKFRHSCGDGNDPQAPVSVITSVYAEYYGEDPAW